MVGVIAAGGMMGGLALFLANLSKQQHITQKKAETGTEITNLHHRILSVFHDPQACTKTLGEGAALYDGRTLTELKNKAGTVILEANPGSNPDPSKDIGRVLRVEQIRLGKVPASGQTREIEVQVKIKKLSRAITGQDTTVKNIPLTVQMDANNKIASCHTKLDAMETKIKKNFCKDIGGIWDAGTSKCSIGNLLQPLWDAILTKANISHHHFHNHDNEYVNLRGDTMSGALNVPELVSSGNVSVQGSVSVRGNVGAQGDVSAGGRVIAGAPVSTLTPTPAPTPGTPSNPCGNSQTKVPQGTTTTAVRNKCKQKYAEKHNLTCKVIGTNLPTTNATCGVVGNPCAPNHVHRKCIRNELVVGHIAGGECAYCTFYYAEYIFESKFGQTGMFFAGGASQIIDDTNGYMDTYAMP